MGDNRPLEKKIIGLAEYLATTNIPELAEFIRDRERYKTLALLISAEDLQEVGIERDRALHFETLPAEERVKFIGHLTPAEMSPIYRKKTRELVTKLREAEILDGAPVQLTDRAREELLQSILAPGKAPSTIKLID